MSIWRVKCGLEVLFVTKVLLRICLLRKKKEKKRKGAKNTHQLIVHFFILTNCIVVQRIIGGQWAERIRPLWNVGIWDLRE